MTLTSQAMLVNNSYEIRQQYFNLYPSHGIISLLAKINTQSTQINNVVGVFADSKLLYTLKVIDNEIYKFVLSIFTRCGIEY